MSLENNLLNKINNFKKNILQMIPTAGENTPSADSSGGSKGNSTNYARSDHQHPLSSAYATASHTHTKSDITNLGDYIEKSNTSGLVKNDGTIDTTQYVSDISGKANVADFDTIEATITYTDNTTETVEFYIVPQS